jgi:mono/diheme cytochrome c family protein
MKSIKNYYPAIILLAILILFSGCNKNVVDTSALYTPISTDVTANATLADLQQGRSLYINNCNSCHALASPDNYTATQWKTILNTMGPRTGMPASDILLVNKYLARGKQ